MFVYTDGVNETFDEILLPVVKEYLDGGLASDVHPAIVNTTFVNQTESSGDDESNTSSSGIHNPAWFALLGVGIVAVIIGYVVWKKKKDKDAVGSEQVEAAARSTVAKGVPTTSRSKEQAAYTPSVQNVVAEVASPDTTFDIDSDDEDEEVAEFEC